MSKQFLTDINLSQNELQNAVIQKLASDPVSPVDGQIWYNTTDNRFKRYDGTTIQVIAELRDVAGLLDYKGGYDAATNTPNLDSTPPAGTIFKGDTYTVTVLGTFYTEEVEIGDMLIAEVDDPASLDDWTRVQFNLPTTVTKKFAVDLDGAGEAAVVRTFAGGRTTFTVTHNLATADVQTQIREIASGEEVIVDVDTIDGNTVDFIFNGSVADDVYRVVIIG
jgi:hypothetical protein